MSYNNRQVDPRFFFQKPKKRFGEILNANLVIPRDVNKDLMTYTQQTSDVKKLAKHYPQKYPSYGRPYYYHKRRF